MASQVAEQFFRHESARLVATLTAHLGTHQLQLAEDVVQEALVRALQTWPYRGEPDNPSAWLTQTAKNIAVDVLRREQRWQKKQEGIASEHERWLSTPAEKTHDTFADDTLRMMFVCFHPQLSTEAQTALAPSPIAAMNRAVAIARVHGASAGICALDAISNRASLQSYHLYHAIRGTLAAELGDTATALTHFRQAESLTHLPAERDFIARRIAECE
jgi:RNA polymerase sigma factor (sigma-70 family)